MQTRLQSKMESYRRIMGCLLLCEIIEHLPTKEKLAIRLVNKDFEDAATHALKLSDNLTLDLRDLRLDSFLLDFMVPQPTPNRLLSRVKVRVQPASSSQERLATLGLNFGADVRHLRMDFPSQSANPIAVSRMKYLLNFCSNLNKLEIRNFQSRIVEVPNEEEVTEVNDLENLTEVKFSIYTSQIPFIYEIIEAPKIHTLSLKVLHARRGLDLLTSPETAANFFRKVALTPNLTLLDFILDVPIRPDDNTIFNILQTSAVTPQKLVVRFNERAEPTEHDKAALRDWLTQLTLNSTLKELVFRSDNETRIDLPLRMIYLKSLDVGTHRSDRSYVIPNQRLAPAQIPSVKTILQTTEDKTLISTEVYPAVKTLIAEQTFVEWRRVLQLPNFASWPSMFPNLTTLSIAVSGNGESLRPILTSMTSLVHLKVNFFDSSFQGHRPPWNVFTNSLQPFMTLETPVKVVMPSTPRSVKSKEIQPGTCAIYNLRGLKTLEVSNTPCSIFLAIVNFTATRKLVALEELKMKINDEMIKKVPAVYIRCLKNYHKRVTTK